MKQKYNFHKMLRLWKKNKLTRNIEIKSVKNKRNAIISEIEGVQGFLAPGDILFLWYLAYTLPNNAKYLEIGSWFGLSAFAFALGLSSNSNFDSKIYCVDTWEITSEQSALNEHLEKKDFFDIFNQNMQKVKIDNFIEPLRGKSVDIAQQLPVNEKFDIIFIDGEHSFEECYSDIKAWYPRLKSGSRLFGHDACPGGGVIRALEKVKAEQGLDFQVIEPPHSWYIWEIV